MNTLYPSRKIYLSKSLILKAGRGVFAAAYIAKGEVIEQCPIIKIPEKEVPLLRKSELVNYYFLWGIYFNKVAIALGYGSVYNHSYEPNATYKKNMQENVIDFVAIQNIKKDEEITVNYNYGNPDDKSKLWIKSIKPAA